MQMDLNNILLARIIANPEEVQLSELANTGE